MNAQAFTCWTGVQFFPRFGWQVNSPLLKASTEAVFALMNECGIEFPVNYYHRLNASKTMRNPDVVCFHPERKEWRFIEVKYKDAIDPRQLNALAFLRAVTGGHIEVRRVVPTATVLQSQVAGTGRFRVTP